VREKIYLKKKNFFLKVFKIYIIELKITKKLF
jgi:hypothetical protein